jgi:hypothetical protein
LSKRASPTRGLFPPEPDLADETPKPAAPARQASIWRLFDLAVRAIIDAVCPILRFSQITHLFRRRQLREPPRRRQLQLVAFLS